MIFVPANAKQNFDRGIQPVHAAFSEISCSLKGQSIYAFSERRAIGQQLGASSVLIGAAGTQGRPVAGSFLTVQAHRDAGGRFAFGHVQNVSGDSAHLATHFLRRRCMIFRCSSAACRSSVASSLCNRRRRISRISLADFPVAQTIKM